MFAAELLAPRAVITPRLRGRMDLGALEQLGREWGVSVDSLICRCHEVGSISDATYRRAFQRLNDLRNLNLFQPDPVTNHPGEVPQLLRSAFALAEAHGLTLTDPPTSCSGPCPGYGCYSVNETPA